MSESDVKETQVVSISAIGTWRKLGVAEKICELLYHEWVNSVGSHEMKKTLVAGLVLFLICASRQSVAFPGDSGGSPYVGSGIGQHGVCFTCSIDAYEAFLAAAQNRAVPGLDCTPNNYLEYGLGIRHDGRFMLFPGVGEFDGVRVPPDIHTMLGHTHCVHSYEGKQGRQLQIGRFRGMTFEEAFNSRVKVDLDTNKPPMMWRRFWGGYGQNEKNPLMNLFPSVVDIKTMLRNGDPAHVIALPASISRSGRLKNVGWGGPAALLLTEPHYQRNKPCPIQTALGNQFKPYELFSVRCQPMRGRAPVGQPFLMTWHYRGLIETSQVSYLSPERAGVEIAIETAPAVRTPQVARAPAITRLGPGPVVSDIAGSMVFDHVVAGAIARERAGEPDPDWLLEHFECDSAIREERQARCRGFLNWYEFSRLWKGDDTAEIMQQLGIERNPEHSDPEYRGFWKDGLYLPITRYRWKR